MVRNVSSGFRYLGVFGNFHYGWCLGGICIRQAIACFGILMLYEYTFLLSRY